MSDTPVFKFGLFHGLIEIVSNRDPPPILVICLSIAVVMIVVPRDNQGETAASIRMRMRRGWTDGARA
jgi:hypothetical protein